MHRPSSLPAEFAPIADRVNHVREVVHGNEWAGSCPSCGGEVHRNGEWPDRCRFWPHSTRAGGKALAWCRSCGWKWTPKKEEKVDPAKIKAVADARAKAEAAHELAVKQARANVQKAKRWQVYYRHLLIEPKAQAAWMKALGVDEFYVLDLAKYWQLGCDMNHTFWMPNGDETMVSHKSNTLTVPLTDMDGKCINIKHRLTHPGADGVRYRQEYRGCGEAVFIANRTLMNHALYAIIAEGEKKAMVAWICANQEPTVQVFGMPLSPSLDLMKSITAEHIVYIPDPDAFDKQVLINRAIGVWARKDFRIVKLPDKLDDYIIAKKKTADWILSMFQLPTWFLSSKQGKKWSEYE